MYLHIFNDFILFLANFPSIYLEPGNKEYEEYYQPKDFIIGNTIFVMGRRYECRQGATASLISRATAHPF